MKHSFEIIPPTVPDFVQIELPPVKRQEGFNPDAGKLPLSELSEGQANEYCDLYKEIFMAKWRESKS